MRLVRTILLARGILKKVYGNQIHIRFQADSLRVCLFCCLFWAFPFGAGFREWSQRGCLHPSGFNP